MRASGDQLYCSATDLSDFLACSHLTALERQSALGGPGPVPYPDPSLDLLRERGEEHEQAVLKSLESRGLRVLRVKQPDGDPRSPGFWTTLSNATVEAMSAGAEVICSGGLVSGPWRGKPDFLIRVDRPSQLGAWSYEVMDAKLARTAKGGALLQVLLYSELVEQVQGCAPQHAHLALGGAEIRSESFRLAEYAAYYRSVRTQFEAAVAEDSDSVPFAPEPVEHCRICAWRSRCDSERREADHLALVAGITRSQRDSLRTSGITTLKQLGELRLTGDSEPPKISAEVLHRIHHQARVQLEGRLAGTLKYELLPMTPAKGLAALPEPSEGDIFLDFEGDPYALGNGLEYLLGFIQGPKEEYTGWWAFSRDDEKAAFERFIDHVMAALNRDPNLHIYHYGVYEPSHIKQLMGRHDTRSEEVDRLLRGERFVDLHRVVRQAVRASVESYSIKKLEPFYGYERDVDLSAARAALASFEAWLEMGQRGSSDDELLEQIRGYNHDDCLSTLRLRDWLEGLRGELAEQTGEPVPRPAAVDETPSAGTSAVMEAVAQRVEVLQEGVAADPKARTPEQHGRWLLAQSLEYHRREWKARAWERFRYLDLDPDELLEDRSALGGLEYLEVAGELEKPKSILYRYRFPQQQHGVKVGDWPLDQTTARRCGQVWSIDEAQETIVLRRPMTSSGPHPRALVPNDRVHDQLLRDSLLRLADSVIDLGLTDSNPHRCAMELLLANPPGLAGEGGTPLRKSGEAALDAAVRLATVLDGSVLPIQGPPGSGKTYTGAQMIVRAIREGKRVGVTAVSHQVIANLMDAACAAARKEGITLRCVQKVSSSDQRAVSPEVQTLDYKPLRKAIDEGEAQLIGGTAWLWAREDMAHSVDLLFIDEAGQFSLANALSASAAADSLILLGDPRQLEQPQQGAHPPGSEISAMNHLLGDEPTVARNRGLFLDRTWRLHPELCAFTSEIFYRGRLESHPGLERQRTRLLPPLQGSGLRLLPVVHAGNQSQSMEEVDAVRDILDDIVAGEYTWMNQHGEELPVSLQDVLVVAPYNAQVSALADALPEGARVGTVDKFQGQEAAVVIYSMASSSPADAPRGMEFLYSPNRLNVATSRARCVAVIVASPELFTPTCRTPDQMRLANAFCRFRELAFEVTPLPVPVGA